MSTTRHYVLHCDAPGCTATYTTRSDLAWATRDAAHADGWTVHVPPRANLVGPAKSEDRCPNHQHPAEAA